MRTRSSGVSRRMRAVLGVAVLAGPVLFAGPEGPRRASDYPAAGHVPDSQRGWERFQTEADPRAPQDEPQGKATLRGTPVAERRDDCFPAETRNVFSEVDKVPTGPGGKLEPFDYRGPDGKVSEEGREAIRGQNTWMLWGEGNEVFWSWLQQDGYGLIDFLVLLDSRERGHRFKNSGLMNQPGMKAQADPGRKLLGLYLDEADGAAVRMTQPPEDVDSRTGALAVRPAPPGGAKHPSQLLEPGDAKSYQEVLARLPDDGVDPQIYGYASGVVGLRLMPNPDFFGNTQDAARARAYWKDRVENAPNDAYYWDYSVQADPKLIRPFRPSMSCAFCHVGPHPLKPPKDPENPAWENLSSTIGNQYWSPPRIFANLTREKDFLHHFLASQQPGTIDTSLVSTDHINNANTINAIFDVPARLARAAENRPEKQSLANLLMPGVEDATPSANPRHTPRVLLDGADSIGVFGALARVYLNIGTFAEEWARCHNPIIGFKPQRPFAVATLRKNSAYWRAAEKYRIPYLARFFTHKSIKNGQSITAPMRLGDIPEGAKLIDAPKAARGRTVFLENCAICHSSKQPKGFSLDERDFSDKWREAPVPAPDQPAHYTLPARFEDWDAFRESRAFKDYRERITKLANDQKEGFFKDNFLSNEVRIPVTLVGTNSGRAVATNGMRGQVWDNFTSDDYKSLPAVGPIRFFNPYRPGGVDAWGNNDEYQPPGGGPGYYRPASLVSLWATAPYLHNNALGLYDHDPSIEGRLKAFEDGIDKLLDKSRRVGGSGLFGDVRARHRELAVSDPGFIYRTTRDTTIAFAAPFIRPLLEGILGRFWTSFLTYYLWMLLALAALLLAYLARPRHASFVVFLIAVLSGALLVLTRLDRWSLAAWLVPTIATGVALAFWIGPAKRGAARALFVVIAIVALVIGVQARRFVSGAKGPLELGPLPMGTPVNLVMNMNPEAPAAERLEGVSALARAILLVRSQGLCDRRALEAFEREAGQALLKASKCPDFVLDRGHWFGESLTPEEKDQLKAFLKTL